MNLHKAHRISGMSLDLLQYASTRDRKRQPFIAMDRSNTIDTYNYDKVRSCSGKTTYIDEQDALDQIAHMKANPYFVERGNLTPYKCRHGNHWHFGNQPLHFSKYK